MCVVVGDVILYIGTFTLDEEMETGKFKNLKKLRKKGVKTGA